MSCSDSEDENYENHKSSKDTDSEDNTDSENDKDSDDDNDFEDEPISKYEESAVENFVKKLTVDPFDVTSFFDPSTEKRKAYIKAQLLDREVEEVNDFVSDEGMDKHAGTEIEQLLKIFDGCQVMDNGSEKRAGSSLQSKSKKVKQEDKMEEMEKLRLMLEEQAEENEKNKKEAEMKKGMEEKEDDLSS